MQDTHNDHNARYHMPYCRTFLTSNTDQQNEISLYISVPS